MTKLATALIAGACITAALVAGLTLSSSARVTQAQPFATEGALNPNAMMAGASHDLPVLAHPIH